MTEVEDVWALIDCGVQEIPPEPVPLEASLGLTLAQDIRAETDQPPFDRSSVDGYAILESERGHQFTVVGEVRAGHLIPGDLRPGMAYRIFTGAQIPHPNWRVIMQEEFHVEGRSIQLRNPNAENCIRHRASDCRKGDIVIPRETVITPGALAVLATNGVLEPLVHRPPIVFHLTTGDEIVPYDKIPGKGQIRDSNGPMIRALLKREGITEIRSEHSAEDIREMQIHFDRAQGADLILISGGASVGDHDHTRAFLEKNGFFIQCSKVNSRPGKPLIFATKGNQVAFGLPGNPVSHFVCFHLFVRHAIAWMLKRKQLQLHRGRMRSRPTGGPNPRVTWWPCLNEGEGALEPLRWNNSGDLSALAKANALAKIPGGAQLMVGSSVQYLTL